MGIDGPVWVMRARSARWFAWRLAGMVTDPSSRFHAVIDKRRRDKAPDVPGELDY
jgi:hypothetical protein